ASGWPGACRSGAGWTIRRGTPGYNASPMRFRRLLMHLSGSLWLVPVLCVIAGAAISFGTIALDRLFDYSAVPSDLVGDSNAARSILSTVAVSMVSLTTLVLT